MHPVHGAGGDGRADDRRGLRPGRRHRQARRRRPGAVRSAAGVVGRDRAAASCGAAPWLMKGLSVAGTAAMFLVGGGILVHGVPALHHWVDRGHGRPLVRLAWLEAGLNAAVGIVAGALVLAVVTLGQRLRRPRDPADAAAGPDGGAARRAAARRADARRRHRPLRQRIHPRHRPAAARPGLPAHRARTGPRRAHPGRRAGAPATAGLGPVGAWPTTRPRWRRWVRPAST